MGRRSGSGGIPHCCETEAEKAMTSRPGDHSGDLEHCLWLGNWEVLLTRAQQAGPLAATVPAMVLPSARLMLAVKSPGGNAPQDRQGIGPPLCPDKGRERQLDTTAVARILNRPHQDDSGQAA